MSERDKIIEKIRKLFELSRSPSIEESQSALKKAHELLTRYNLSRTEINVNNYTDRKIDKYKRLKFYEAQLFAIVGEFFFVKSLGLTDVYIMYVGEETNCRIADYTFCYLIRNIRRLVSEFKKSLSPKKRYISRVAASYGMGLVMGIRESLTESQKKEQESGLVYAGDPGLEAFIKDKFNPKARPEYKPDYYNNVMKEGFEDGKKIKIHAGIDAERKESALMLQ